MSTENGVGNIESDARGTAARYNSGKVRMDLLPLHLVVSSLDFTDRPNSHVLVYDILYCIAQFQKTHEISHLDDALAIGADHWLDCANVFGYGAKKYASWNWVKGMAWSIPIGCISRHAFRVFDSELDDPESGLPHIGHIMCNVVMLRTYVESYPEGNDLPPKDFSVR